MISTIYRQFTAKIWEDSQTYEDLSAYLEKHQIRNIIDHHTVKGQFGGLELEVTFGPTWFQNVRSVKTKMTGTIVTSDLDGASQTRAAGVLTLLAEYMPNYLK